MLDIHSKSEYPSCALSNFAPHRFVLDGMVIQSMEGFLQALKYQRPEEQIRVCSLVGREAKLAGQKKRLWRWRKTVWWRGQPYGLFSDELQRLIDRAYKAMYDQCPEFRLALKETKDEPLMHSIGKGDLRETILTEYHFIRRLENLRTAFPDEDRAI